MKFHLLTVSMIGMVLLAGCGNSDPQAEAFAAIQAKSPRAVRVDNDFYGPADESYEKFPEVVSRYRDALGNVWTVTYINFNPVTLRMNRLIITVGTHAATGVQRHRDNDVEVKFGNYYYGFTPGQYLTNGSIKIVDVDEASHTLVMEQFYQLSPKKYLRLAAASAG